MEDAGHEQELIQRANNGDRVAVTVLLTQLHQRLKHYIANKIPRDIQPVIDADDILQETQINVYRHLNQFEDQGPDSFYRWVATIAIHRLRNTIKAHRAQKRGGGRIGITSTGQSLEDSVVILLDLMESPENSPSQCVAGKEATNALNEALIQLPEHYQQVIRMVYLEGRSVAEAAEVMEKTPRAIHNICNKAKHQLRNFLGSSSRYLGPSGKHR